MTSVVVMISLVLNPSDLVTWNTQVLFNANGKSISEVCNGGVVGNAVANDSSVGDWGRVGNGVAVCSGVGVASLATSNGVGVTSLLAVTLPSLTSALEISKRNRKTVQLGCLAVLIGAYIQFCERGSVIAPFDVR